MLLKFLSYIVSACVFFVCVSYESTLEEGLEEGKQVLAIVIPEPECRYLLKVKWRFKNVFLLPDFMERRNLDYFKNIN